MTKIRVYEYAKKNQVSSKVVISKLKDMGIEVSNHMAALEDEAVHKLERLFNPEPPQKEKPAIQSGNTQPRQGGQQTRPAGQAKQGQQQTRPTGQTQQGGQTSQSQQQRQSNQGAGNQSVKREQSSQQNQHRSKPNQPSQTLKSSTNSVEIGNDKTVNSQKVKNNKPTGKGFEGKKHVQDTQRKENKAFNRGKQRGKQANNRQNTKQQQQLPKRKERELPEKITFTESLSILELSKKLHREPSEIIKKLFLLGVVSTINQVLDKDGIELICAEYGVEVEEIIKIDVTDLDAVIADADDTTSEENTVERPPVVTIMGHVDHGKTTLLDSIRHTKVTEGEAGGITQHIGAYQIETKGKKITFLDTPGHAAFTTMRARGAQVTDITIIVVAADDGVMPQTVEAINHAKAAEVPIIVAVNKIDKEGANPDRVKQELTEHGLVPEEWGGDTIFVPISALSGEGIDNLLEMILLVSEVEEYKANLDRKAIGTVIEAELDKGRGTVATLLVQNGTLHVGDPIVVGTSFGKVRAMVNDIGRRVKDAGPSTPVEITGLNEVPQAGDRFVVFADEKTARQVGETRAQRQIQAQRNENSRVTLETLFEQMKQGEMKELNVIVKGDVQGSVEAVSASLKKIEVEGAKIKIIHSGVGAITEYDIILATASNAIVIGFNVRPDVNAKRVADAEKVDIRLHRIIYKAIEEIESAMKGMLDPEFEEKVIGQAEVRQTIKISKIGMIAGSYVTDGKITRNSGIRLIRDGIVVFEGELDTLKRFKDDVKEVAQGYECGITIKNFNDVKEGDVIEAYVMEEIKRG